MTTLIIDGTPSAVVPATAPDIDESTIDWPGRNIYGEMAVGDQAHAGREVYRAMLSAADPSLLGAVIEMRAALEGLLSWYGCDTDGHHRERARAVLARVTIQETSDAG